MSLACIALAPHKHYDCLNTRETLEGFILKWVIPHSMLYGKYTLHAFQKYSDPHIFLRIVTLQPAIVINFIRTNTKWTENKYGLQFLS